MITTSSMVIGLFVGFFLGHIIDRCTITPILILTYLFRATGLLVMTCLITDFEKQKGLLYCSFFAMTAGTFCQTIVVMSLLNKRMIAPTREIMNGMSQSSRALGVMTVTGIGGYLSKINVNAPFFMVGCFDLLVVLLTLILVCAGRLRQ